MKKTPDYQHSPTAAVPDNHSLKWQIIFLLRVFIIKPLTSRTILKSKYDQDTAKLNSDISSLRGQLKSAEDARDAAIRERDDAQIKLSFLIDHPQSVTYITEQYIDNMVGRVEEGATGFQIRQKVAR